MQLEIVDYTNQKAYISDRGVTIRMADLRMVSAIQTEEGVFVVEMEHYYQQQFLKTDIATLEEAKEVIKSLLQDDDNILVDALTFEKGISFMQTAQPFRTDIFNKSGLLEGLEEDSLEQDSALALLGIGGAQSTGRNEPLFKNMPIFDYVPTLLTYAQRDAEVTLKYFEALTKDK